MQPIIFEVKGLNVVIDWFDEIPSTHQFIIEGLKSGTLCAPYAVGADIQTQGIGSRGNSWLGEKGNLFFSFCVEEKHLPSDLPLASISIYFSALTKQILEEKGSKVWLKWPNDFYLEEILSIIYCKIFDYVYVGNTLESLESRISKSMHLHNWCFFSLSKFPIQYQVLL